MSSIEIHVLHVGHVCVSPNLPFGGVDCSILKASGVFSPKSKRLWLPVSSYLIKCEYGNILFDCGWHRNMSPNGVFDKKAQIKSLGSIPLYLSNQGLIKKGEAIDEQLAKINIKPSDLDLVLLSHLDCDHANGLKLVKDAKEILVSNDELNFTKNNPIVNKIRYNSKWWKDTKIKGFNWNGVEGPFNKSYDVFGDGSIVMINIPGHSKGLCALKIKNSEDKFVLLVSDGGYSRKSWEELICPGISDDKKAQLKSLKWIKKESLDDKCVESLANHDGNVKPHVISL